MGGDEPFDSSLYLCAEHGMLASRHCHRDDRRQYKTMSHSQGGPQSGTMPVRSYGMGPVAPASDILDSQPRDALSHGAAFGVWLMVPMWQQRCINMGK